MENMKLKYKVGDRVLIKNSDWYNMNKNADGFVHCGDRVFDNYMSVFCGSVVTIGGVGLYGYAIREDIQCRTWTDEMIECKVSEDYKPKFKHVDKIIQILQSDWNDFKNRHIPDNYHFVDKNGKEINISDITLEKKPDEN